MQESEEEWRKRIRAQIKEQPEYRALNVVAWIFFSIFVTGLVLFYGIKFFCL